MTELPDFADLDTDRAARRGFAEAILCEPKTLDQLRLIAADIRHRAEQVTLFTRASAEQAAAIHAELPDAHYDEQARLLAWPARMPESSGSLVVVVSAGTSDQPVAREALLCAQWLGCRTEWIPDAGVAGLHRILRRVELLRQAGVLIVAAGMDGALPSVVAGLVAAPVIALPTSIGYGASFGGVAALLTMLNSCSPGVAVVNIDNGYGAGYLAAQISRR